MASGRIKITTFKSKFPAGPAVFISFFASPLLKRPRLEL